MIILWLAATSIYAVILLMLTVIWMRIESEEDQSKNKSVAVIIVFRNEEDQLNALVESLAAIDYPEHLLNIIFVNDHSEDASSLVLQEALINFPFKHTIKEMSSSDFGKKTALICAVETAKEELILTTDADCLVPSNWVKDMQRPFENRNIKFVAGCVDYMPSKITHHLLRVELAALMGVTGASIELQKPSMANGANMCFRRADFQKIKPYDDNKHLSTGDDVFLLSNIVQNYGARSIKFQPKSLVLTRAPKSVSQFMHQRWRWASKWQVGKSFIQKLPIIILWLFHLFYAFSLIYCLFNQLYFIVSIGLSIKLISEYLFISRVYKILSQRLNIFGFLLLGIFYSFYVIFFGLTANFVSYKWKGRAYAKFNG